MKIRRLDLDILKLKGHWDIPRTVENCMKSQMFRRESWSGTAHLRANGAVGGRGVVGQAWVYEVKNGERGGEGLGHSPEVS